MEEAEHDPYVDDDLDGFVEDDIDPDENKLRICYSSFARDKYWLQKIPASGLVGFKELEVMTTRADSDGGQPLQPEDMMELFRLVRTKLTKLEGVLVNTHDSDTAVPIHCIGQLLSKRGDTLESIYVHKAIGMPPDLDMTLKRAAATVAPKLEHLCLSLPDLSTLFSLIPCFLKHVHLVKATLTIKFKDPNDHLGEHLLSTYPCEWQSLYNEEEDSDDSSEEKLGLEIQMKNIHHDGFLAILNTPNIPRLAFCYINGIDSMADKLGPNLRQNSTLTELHCRLANTEGRSDFKKVIGIRNVIRVIEALEENSTLKKLQLSCFWNEGELKVESVFGLGLSRAIENTAALEFLELETYFPDEDRNGCFHALIVMMRALAVNNTLRTVHLGSFFPDGCQDEDTTKDQASFFSAVKDHYKDDEPFATMVISEIQSFELALKQRNTTLRKFQIGVSAPHVHAGSIDIPFLSEHAKFILELNGLGRKDLFQNLADSRSWIDFLLQHKGDARIVFYLITTNPSIFLEAYGKSAAVVPLSAGTKRKTMD